MQMQQEAANDRHVPEESGHWGATAHRFFENA